MLLWRITNKAISKTKISVGEQMSVSTYVLWRQFVRAVSMRCKPTQPEEADAWTGSRRKPHCDQPPTKTKTDPQGQLRKDIAAIFGSHYLLVQFILTLRLDGPIIHIKN